MSERRRDGQDAISGALEARDADGVGGTAATRSPFDQWARASKAAPVPRQWSSPSSRRPRGFGRMLRRLRCRGPPAAIAKVSAGERNARRQRFERRRIVSGRRRLEGALSIVESRG